jgi:hypothetical protein
MDPLAATGDANRGIPTVLEVPEHHHHRHHHHHSFHAKARGSMDVHGDVSGARGHATDENLLCYSGTSIDMEDVMML